VRRLLRFLLSAALFAAVFVTGFSIGLSVNVFMSRGAPIVHGGGELILLLAIPAAVFIGYRLKGSNKQK
jgi:hypothetical protein